MTDTHGKNNIDARGSSKLLYGDITYEARDVIYYVYNNYGSGQKERNLLKFVEISRNL